MGSPHLSLWVVSPGLVFAMELVVQAEPVHCGSEWGWPAPGLSRHGVDGVGSRGTPGSSLLRGGTLRSSTGASTLALGEKGGGGTLTCVLSCPLFRGLFCFGLFALFSSKVKGREGAWSLSRAPG